MEMLPNVPPSLEILEELGRGSTGIVFKANDKNIGRLVAVKTLIPKSGHEETARRQRFLREARCMAACRHANIVQAHQVGEHAAQPYVVREFVDGRTLQAELNKELFTDRQACKMVELVTRALECVHAHGLVHRQLTPDNVLIAHDGAVKLIGFGKARASDDIPSPASVATDIQALGVMLYHLMTREHWFAKGRLPEPLEKICLRCGGTEPENQYLSAKELGEDLRRYLR